MSLQFPMIGSTSDCFFWSMDIFASKMYCGTYGVPKIYNYPPWSDAVNLDAGESVTKFSSLSSILYAITENLGRIYKKVTDTNWEQVHQNAFICGMGMTTLGTYIYGSFTPADSSKTRIVRSSNGTSWPEALLWTDGEIWALNTFESKVYAHGQKLSTGETWAKRSSNNGITWDDVIPLCGNALGYWDVSQPFGNYFYLSMGRRSDGKIHLYRFDGTNLSGNLVTITNYYCHDMCVCDGKLYYLVGPFIKPGSSDEVTYNLWRSSDGIGFTHVKDFKTFPKYSHGNWRTRGNLASLDGELYVGIQDEIYKMVDVPTGYSITYKFRVRNGESESWSGYYDNITDCPISRFIEITATLTRESLSSPMPTIENMKLGYRLHQQPIFI